MITKMVVGLGNPERRFNSTRHNIGFTIADALVHYYKATYGIIKIKGQPATEIRQKVIHKINVIFLKPMDWINSSGISVGRATKAIGVDSKDIMVIHDDMDFDFGDFKLKASGGSGRHNGVQSVIDAIGKNFMRFRAGIGRPVDPDTSGRDYVLSKFDTHEQKYFPKLFKLMIQIVDSFLLHGAQKTMNTFNRRKEVNE